MTWYYENKPYDNTPDEYQIKNISVKRTFGGLRHYQKTLNVIAEYEQELNPIGKSTLDQIKNYAISWRIEDETNTKERYLDYVRQKERCLTMKPKPSLISEYFFQTSGLTSS